MLFNERIATIASFLVCINLGFLVYSQYVLTEITLTTLLLAFCERFLNFYKTYSLYALAAAGFFLGCSIAIKPAALLYPLVLSIILLFDLRNKTNFSQNLKHTLIFLLSFLLIPTLYLIRNAYVYNSFSICSLARVNLNHYFLPKLIAENENISQEKALEKVKIMKDPQRELEILVKKNPFMAIKIWLKNVLKTFFGLHTTALKMLLEPNLKSGECSFFKVEGGSLKERAWNYIKYGTNSKNIHLIGIGEAILNLLCYLFLITTLIWLAIKKEYFLLIFIISFIAYFGLITGHDGCGRFRMMIEPILIICEAVSIYLLYYLITKQKVYIK
jgi:4-amino-4-deoxy-L-arabinose transferase-like glycosyltransferase